jgi:hypothetical protein
MNRKTSPFATLVFVLATLSLMCAQEVPTPQSPVLPLNILGPQLIVWSQLQKPQPVPQPLPAADRDTQRPDSQPAPTQVAPPQQQPPLQTFVGTIVKDGSRYVLQASGKNVYPLDDQDKARQYEGKQVRIAGILDAHENSLHIASIELIS